MERIGDKIERESSLNSYLRLVTGRRFSPGYSFSGRTVLLTTIEKQNSISAWWLLNGQAENCFSGDDYGGSV